MSQGLNKIHTVVLGCSAELLEIRLANKVHTSVLGCSSGRFKIKLAGQTISLEIQIHLGFAKTMGIDPNSEFRPAAEPLKIQLAGAARSSQ